MVSVLAVALVSCGGDEPAATPAATSGSPAQPFTGVVTDIRSPELGVVEAFTVKSGEESYEFLIDPKHEYGFPLDHLNAHRASSDPVVVTHEQRDEGLFALEIADG